ncbi:hypothetical protein WMF38_21535 [Sorangium sp. So ce118]
MFIPLFFAELRCVETAKRSRGIKSYVAFAKYSSSPGQNSTKIVQMMGHVAMSMETNATRTLQWLQ